MVPMGIILRSAYLPLPKPQFQLEAPMYPLPLVLAVGHPQWMMEGGARPGGRRPNQGATEELLALLLVTESGRMAM